MGGCGRVLLGQRRNEWWEVRAGRLRWTGSEGGRRGLNGEDEGRRGRGLDGQEGTKRRGIGCVGRGKGREGRAGWMNRGRSLEEGLDGGPSLPLQALIICRTISAAPRLCSLACWYRSLCFSISFSCRARQRAGESRPVPAFAFHCLSSLGPALAAAVTSAASSIC